MQHPQHDALSRLLNDWSLASLSRLSARHLQVLTELKQGLILHRTDASFKADTVGIFTHQESHVFGAATLPHNRLDWSYHVSSVPGPLTG